MAPSGYGRQPTKHGELDVTLMARLRKDAGQGLQVHDGASGGGLEALMGAGHGGGTGATVGQF